LQSTTRTALEARLCGFPRRRNCSAKSGIGDRPSTHSRSFKRRCAHLLAAHEGVALRTTPPRCVPSTPSGVVMREMGRDAVREGRGEDGVDSGGVIGGDSPGMDHRSVGIDSPMWCECSTRRPSTSSASGHRASTSMTTKARRRYCSVVRRPSQARFSDTSPALPDEVAGSRVEGRRSLEEGVCVRLRTKRYTGTHGANIVSTRRCSQPTATRKSNFRSRRGGAGGRSDGDGNSDADGFGRPWRAK
jgi:hypothetical protein